MKRLVIVLNIIIAIYFFVMANFLFWGSMLALFYTLFTKPELQKNLVSLFINILIAPFLIYVAILFFQKAHNKYTYGMILLVIIWLEMQIYRFLFVTYNRLELTDLFNLLFFALPLALVYLTKFLDQKLVSKSR